MSTIVVDDLRHEMDENVVAALTTTKRKPSGGGPKLGDVKASFLIRTLPRDCNPTPVPTGGMSASTSGLLSPLMNKRSSRQEAELEVLQLDNPFDDITEEKLRQLTGNQDLKRVTSLQISVDSSKQSVEVIGELLPSLQQLRLQPSSLSSFRDLGTSLRSLRILWAMHCQISDLDGIGALLNLQELYLQHNNVSDMSPLAMHEELRIIDLEGNRVADIGQTEQLAFCPQLTTLNLTGNPVESVERYRQIVANFVPQLASLDDRAFSDSEQAKLSDSEIDAVIIKHREQQQADTSGGESTTNLRTLGSSDINSPRQLSYSSSTASLNGLPVDSSHNDDSGSRLTHGTDIVFAGNVTSALRRHRYEAETGSMLDVHGSSGASSEGSGSAVDSRPSSAHGLPDRPKTPARRISITDTLDRARELDTHKNKSRDAILDELKSWQLDSIGTSQIGVPRDTDEALYMEIDSSANRSRSRRKGSIDIIGSDATAAARARLERRPNTSAGVLRNGANVREAFVDISTSKNNCPRPSSRGGSSRQRGSSSTSSGVDILILDGGDDIRRPCSPSKTPRGIYTTACSCTKALGHHHDWNLELLSPKVDITTAKRHLPSSLTSKQQLERSQMREESSDSDADDESSVCPAASTEFGSPTPVPKTAFFNVAESLNAIEKWRDEMEYDAEDTAILSVASLQQSCLSPRTGTGYVREISVSDGSNSCCSVNQQNSPTRQQQDSKLALGPGNHESDNHNVKLLKEKHGLLKTRDGFRSYFRGMEEERLEGILHQAFAVSDKVRRRMQLMSGFFRHELQ
ncbi:hypothetical protein PF005_g17467 [Phytophthora fragariae]|uniref:Leucine-rich repeat-containing protein 56 n=1 Tax=Phytophthora fragariae TaxID=53985 RepID=A0A6A4D2B3_9STRA|nr:hypothetical protein PF003_g22303 [Phytophthora fragariae]KAE8930895.1 hypothetical protein PF009_g19022 [Phytophthora fragariae]KAE9014051.1 hypothetical protein PF011_g8234 [Phytophthora fragariae]KAE9096321.1 hypothetical protein PF010_g16380 [Phytophthora fragariae]KAE9096660.1 hypothetical protein PF007_g16917 [Phytophthora fragariae]